MTLFQSIISAILATLGELLPFSTTVHFSTLTQTLGWPTPETPLIATFYFGLFSSLVIHFRHDFLSHFSSVLKILIYRRKPTAIDELMPFYILCALVPPVLFWFFAREHFLQIQDNPVLLLSVFAAATIPFWFYDSYSKRNKGFYDWNVVDALCVGVGLAIGQIPGVGCIAAGYLLAMMRNYSRPGAYKFILYCSTPLIAAQAYWAWQGQGTYTFVPVEISPLVFWVTLLVSFISGLFILNIATEWFEKITIKRFAVLRLLIAAAGLVTYFVMNRSV